jgi:hypothetical protein
VRELLDPTDDHQNDQYYEDGTETSAWIVTPAAAVWPDRKYADHDEYKQN